MRFITDSVIILMEEIEVKFLTINPKEIEKKLVSTFRRKETPSVRVE